MRSSNPAKITSSEVHESHILRSPHTAGTETYNCSSSIGANVHTTRHAVRSKIVCHASCAGYTEVDDNVAILVDQHPGVRTLQCDIHRLLDCQITVLIDIGAVGEKSFHLAAVEINPLHTALLRVTNHCYVSKDCQCSDINLAQVRAHNLCGNSDIVAPCRQCRVFECPRCTVTTRIPSLRQYFSKHTVARTAEGTPRINTGRRATTVMRRTKRSIAF
mmetsp:Transcript_43765/g.68512  ORF Transcript_43765/g.68512 Transcript_43765/m.68512 type:complete len:218 (+) Transcript_43765:501-1154(+)